MKKTLFLFCVATVLVPFPRLFAQQLAVEAETVYTVGPAGTIKNGVILIQDGKITAVGPANKIRVPKGSKRLQAKIITPGLIDAQTSLGLSGIYNVGADQDQDETTNPNTAEVRALDSFNPREPLLAFVRSYGVTTFQTVPGWSNPIAGQAAIIKNHGMNVEQMALKKTSAMIFNLGNAPKVTYGRNGKSPTSRMGTAALIRQALVKAQEYEEKWKQWEGTDKDKKDPSKRPERDLKKEALAQLLEGKIPAIFVAHREDDIVTALRLGREFNLKVILSQATEGYLVREELRRSGVPVLVGPTLQRVGSMETFNTTLENAALLAESGIPIAFSAGFESYVPKNRVLLFEAAVAAVNGLGVERALRAATLDAARILGIADRVGSLEPGKDADLVLYDGDPFEYTSHVEAVVINGEVVYRREKK